MPWSELSQLNYSGLSEKDLDELEFHIREYRKKSGLGGRNKN